MNITINIASVIPQEKQNGSEKYFQVNPYDKNEANKTIEKNTSKKIGQNASKTIDFKAYLDNMIQELKLLTTPLGKIITMNMMMGTEQPD